MTGIHPLISHQDLPLQLCTYQILLNELQNLLYSNPNIKNVAESAEKYNNI